MPRIKAAPGGDEALEEHIPVTLKSVFIKLKNLNLLLNRGVQRSFLQEWTANERFKGKQSEEHEAFISKVLHSTPLMKQSSMALRTLQPIVSELDEQGLAVLDASATALHHIKMCTAHTCWYDWVMPLRQEVSELSTNNERLLAQMKEARASYLKEVVALREQARTRGDPLAQLSLDVQFFFEPTQMLEPDEQKYFLDLLSEKLKMMTETNPQVEKTFDFGQVSKLVEQVQNTECAQLRQALREKQNEAEKLRKALTGGFRSENSDAAPALKGAAAEKLMSALEEQLGRLRAELWEERRGARQLQERLEALQTERDEFENAWKEESNEGLLRQNELKRARGQQEALQGELESARKNLLAAKQERPSSAPRSRRGSRAGVPSEAKATDQEERRMLEARCQLLEARCQDLEALCDSRATGLRAQTGEASLEEVESLAEYGESLGCACHDWTSNGVRVCSCGNLLMEDAIFCRKCGTEWKDKSNNSQETVETLGHRLGQLGEARRRSVDRLNGLLRGSGAVAPGPGGAELQGTPAAGSAWDEEVADAEQEVTMLEREKSNVEAKMLVEMAEAAMTAFGPDEEDQSCSCNCAEQLHIARQLLAKMRLLCSHLIGRLKRSVADNAKMSSTLSSTRSMLDTAARAISESVASAGSCPDQRLLESLKAIEQTRNECVFYRLYQDARVRHHRQRNEPKAEPAGQPRAPSPLAAPQRGSEDSLDGPPSPQPVPSASCEPLAPQPPQPSLIVQRLSPAAKVRMIRPLTSASCRWFPGRIPQEDAAPAGPAEEGQRVASKSPMGRVRRRSKTLQPEAPAEPPVLPMCVGVSLEAPASNIDAGESEVSKSPVARVGRNSKAHQLEALAEPAMLPMCVGFALEVPGEKEPAAAGPVDDGSGLRAARSTMASRASQCGETAPPEAASEAASLLRPTPSTRPSVASRSTRRTESTQAQRLLPLIVDGTPTSARHAGSNGMLMVSTPTKPESRCASKSTQGR